MRRRLIGLAAVLALTASLAVAFAQAPIDGLGPILTESITPTGRLEYRVYARECRSPAEAVRAHCHVVAQGAARNTLVVAGRAHIVEVMRGLAGFAHFHALSTSTTTVQNTDVGCPNELTTEYTTNNTRATGTQEQGETGFIFRTVGANAVDADVTISKFCLMSTSTVGTGTPWTHILLNQAVPVTAGKTVITDYIITVN